VKALQLEVLELRARCEAAVSALEELAGAAVLC
jgi:hypothetical protein